MPQSRPMPSIGVHCHELRINDENKTWRIFYRIDEDAIIVIHWVDKKTSKTPQDVIDLCKKRLTAYEAK